MLQLLEIQIIIWIYLYQWNETQIKKKTQKTIYQTSQTSQVVIPWPKQSHWPASCHGLQWNLRWLSSSLWVYWDVRHSSPLLNEPRGPAATMARFYTTPQHNANTGPVTSLLHLLHNSDDTGLKNMYPLVYRLFSIATTLPLSTAEVERVFHRWSWLKPVTGAASRQKHWTTCWTSNSTVTRQCWNMSYNLQSPTSSRQKTED